MAFPLVSPMKIRKLQGIWEKIRTAIIFHPSKIRISNKHITDD
jgi:hypothetical protein